MIRIEPSLLNKVGKGPFFHQAVDDIWTFGVIIEVFEVHFEEMYLFFYFLEDYLVVPVVPCSFEDSCKK